ncbi:MAG: hypothetical protein M3340_16080, partial [Actinomycetota bacterium]|nr:hypothetical protein [Actinomycetota bacterium]
MAQARLVASLLDGDVELVPIRTSGDENVKKGSDPFFAVGDKSRFVKEIEEALLRGEVDLAVHSAKDVPGELPDGLAIVGVPERADPRDALCGPASLDDAPEGARVGTSSLRRRAQLLARRPDLVVEDLRGNVDTRLRRLAEGELGSLRVLIVLAVIWTVFAIANESFLTSINLTNLALQTAALVTISIGVVLVLLLGEIDLSVAWVSSLAAGTMAVLNVKSDWNPVLAIGAGLLVGAGIGLLQG